jgi:integrase
METTLSRKKAPRRKAYHVAKLGRVKVPVYRRVAPNGSPCFMVVNYSTGKRRFDSYPTEAEAIEAAAKLARQMSERQVLAAAMTNEQASEYAAAIQKLAPFGVGLLSGADTLAEVLKSVGGLQGAIAAAKFYAERHKPTVAKQVADAVVELLTVKAARGASERYLGDLRGRLDKFATNFKKDTRNISTPQIQDWLDSQKLGTQSYANNRRVLHVFFEFCVARGYATDNPVVAVENVKIHNGEIEIFTPSEIARLLAAAEPDFLPSLALGAFSGLRSAEIERLDWKDIHLAERHIVIGKDAAKTASRRIVPIADNLAAWLALTPESKRKGKVWKSGWLYKEQQVCADATAIEANLAKGIPAKPAVKWKANALRHSFATYSFALTNDAGRIAGIMGNSPAIVNRHYRQLTTASVAQKWFAVRPPESAQPSPAVAGATTPAQLTAGEETTVTTNHWQK